MKLVSLNLWGGRVSSKYDQFFQTHNDIDTWCFQEVFRKIPGGPVAESLVHFDGYQPDPELLETLKEHLPAYTIEFCQTFKDAYGLAAFLKPGLQVVDRGETLVAKGEWEGSHDFETNDHHRKIQWVELKVDGRQLLIVNAHLTHRPVGKGDSEKRLRQSKIIVDFLSMFDCPKILVGDFNLMPETESIKMIEAAGMRNLVKEYGVTSTRTEVYRRYKDGPRFADYIFVSPDIKVNDFHVMPDVVSDHSPLFLDFDLK